MAIRRRRSPVHGQVVTSPYANVPNTAPATGTAASGRIATNRALHKRRVKAKNKRVVDRAIRRGRNAAPVDAQEERVIERGYGKGIPDPKPTPKAHPGIKRPGGKKGPNAPAPKPARGGASAPSGGVSTRSGSGGTPSGGGGGGGVVKPPKTPKIKKDKKGKKGPGRSAAGAATELTDSTVEQSIRKLLEPAYEELTRQQVIADRNRWLQTQDVNALGGWMGGQHTAGEQFLAEQQGKSRAAMAAQTLPDANSTAQVAEAARQSVGGNADIMKASGLDTANQINAGYVPTMEAMRQNPEMLTQAFSAALAGGRGVTNANLANLLSTTQGRHGKRLSEISSERSKLGLEEAGLVQRERESRRTAEQDAKMFNLIAQEKLGKLEVDRFEAKTQRLKVISTAQNAAEANRLKAEIAAGTLSFQQAKEQFRQQLDSQKLSLSKKKLELARFDQINKRNVTAQQKATTYVTDRYNQFLKQFDTTNWDEIPRDQQRKVVRQLISGMRSSGGNNLTQAQAISILGGVLGDIPVRDPAFRRMVTSLWRK